MFRPDTPITAALLSVLRCPACHQQLWQAGHEAIHCGSCGRGHAVRQGVLHMNVVDEHPEVGKERTSVPATEMTPELGGWKEAYTAETDRASSLAQAYLSLPYGNGSEHFTQPGYFQNVQRFAAEFDFVARHLPTRGLLLDVGADGTWSTAQLARRGLTCIALDITDHLTLSQLFQSACPPYALISVDMHEPVFCDEAFDAITAFNAMHHSTRLDALAANFARTLKPGGVLAFVEPYVQNAEQEAAFGAPQSALGINENVHTTERWAGAFAAAGLSLEAYSLSDSFNAIYRKVPGGVQTPDILADYYDAMLAVTPTATRVQPGMGAQFAVTVKSRGRAAWASRGPTPVRLSYHVFRITDAGRAMVAFDNPRTLITSFTSPHEPETFDVSVTLDEPGTFDIEFDLVHEARCWFAERGGQTSVTRMEVGGTAAREELRPKN